MSQTAHMAGRIMFNAFSMNCVSHLQHGLWGRSDTRQMEYAQLDPWLELAQILEKGCFDTLFLADVTAIYDNYDGGPEAAIRNAMQVPVNDPMMLVPAMASVTEHLGFAVTSSVLSEHPYNFARRASTLDHLTGGRFGWNIVTSYLPGTARNLGLADLPDHDRRYDLADDYMDVVYKLWETSWDDDAVVRDIERGVYADPSRVHTIDHEGPYFTVPGPHVCEPSPQRTPVLFQAGSSERGRAFAARHAEATFVVAHRAGLTSLVSDVRGRVEASGRRGEDIKFVLAVCPVVGGTEAEARAKAAELTEQLSIEGGLVHMSGNLGVDLGALDPDRPIADLEFNRVTGILRHVAEQEPDKTLTVGDLARRQMSGQFMVGSNEQIADRLERLVAAGADGFNLVYTSTPGSFVDFIDGVAPILQDRGLMQREYQPGTLREKLTGSARLPERHPGRRFG